MKKLFKKENVLKATISGYHYLVCCISLGFLQLVTTNLNAQALSGTYSIGGTSPNYATFTAAVTDLTSKGVSGPVVFNVAAGTYTERPILPAINGASATNTIHFKGAGRGNTVLTNTGTSNNNSITLRMNGADYFTFSDMDIVAAGQNYGMGVHFGNSADYNTFLRVGILGNTTSTANRTGCVVFSSSTSTPGGNGNNGSYNSFDEVEFLGAYYGIYFRGTSTTNPVHQNNVKNSTFSGQSYYALYSYYHANFSIENNTITLRTPFPSSNSSWGIYNYYGSNFQINGNRIFSNIGIENIQCNKDYYDPAIDSRISNNMIIGAWSCNALFVLDDADSIQVLHNSLVSSSAGGSATNVFYATGSDGNDVRNNLFVSYGVGTAIRAFSTQNNSTYTHLDGNVYYGLGTSLINLNGSDITLVSDWQQTEPDFNKNSFSFDPNFSSNSDLHLSATSPNTLGVFTGLVLKDIDGESRNLLPFPGADEKAKIANNAGVLAISSPAKGFCSGVTLPLKALITNSGNNALDSVRVFWTLDGVQQTPVYVTTLIDTVLGQNPSSLEVTLGNISYPTGAARAIRIWTSHPNGSIDLENTDDTISVQSKPSLSGTYTIGKSNADYTSFGSAANDLFENGVCGPITFLVSADTFREVVKFRAIPGSSAQNTITIQGAGKYATVLSYKGNAASNQNTMVFNGAKHFIIRDLTVFAEDPTYAVGIALANNADSNKFTNLYIKLNQNWSYNSSGISLSGSLSSVNTQGPAAGSYNQFDSLEFFGGYFGISICGPGTQQYLEGNQVSNCSFTGQFNYGISSSFHRNFIVSHNTIKDLVINASGIGINYCSNFLVERNEVEASRSGLTLSNINSFMYSSNLPTRVSNNMLGSGYSESAAFGYTFSIENTTNLEVYHNTCYNGLLENVYVSNSSSLNIRNNIFANYNPQSNGYAFRSNGTVTYDTLDFNNYYSAGGNTIGIGGLTYSTLADWQLASPLINVNSYSLDPIVVSSTNLRLLLGGNTQYGTPLGLNQDIDGNLRSLNLPVIGAYEKPVKANGAALKRLSSPSFFCGGNQTIKVEVANSGTVLLDSVRIYWELDGTAMTPVYANALALATQGLTEISLGTVNFANQDGKKLKVWTSHPNGVQDSINWDDTLYLEMKPSLNGTYSIGGAGADYPNLVSAAEDLSRFGVCGPVVFNIAPGLYEGRVLLNRVEGTSTTNTVSFIGSGIGNTVITHNTSQAFGKATLEMQGVKHFRFSSITIEAPDKEYGIGALLQGGSDSNEFKDLRVQMHLAAQTENTVGIVISNNPYDPKTGNYNLFERLDIDGGHTGIKLISGGPSEPYMESNQIYSCNFSNQVRYAISSSFHKNFLFKGNTIDLPLRGIVDPIAIFLYYSSDFTLESNSIQSQGSGIVAQFVNKNQHNSAYKTKIFNSEIVIPYPGRSGSVGIELDNSDDVAILHNSILNRNGGYGAISFKQSLRIDCRNNIFASVNSFMTSVVYLDNNSTFTHLDYNFYYGRQGRYLVYGPSISCFDLTCWSTNVNEHSTFLIGLGSNSVGNDQFYYASLNDLHLAYYPSALVGPHVGIDTDFDGEIRCPIKVTIGADQIVEYSILPVPGISVQDSIFVSSPATFTNTTSIFQNEAVEYIWYVDGVEVTRDLNMSYVFSAVGSYSIKLVATTCAGLDSITEIIQVVNPSSAPAVDFTANPLRVFMNENSTLIDLSEHGPSIWNWTVIPLTDPNAQYVVSPGTTSNQPEVLLSSPGYYTVCLQTENALGQSPSLCKDGHLYVYDEKVLGTHAGSNFEHGILKSEEPVVANRYSFLIKPDSCITEIELLISKFQIKNVGDSLLVYDGEDNTGLLIASFTEDNPAKIGSKIKAYSSSMFIQWITIASGIVPMEPFFEGIWSSTKNTAQDSLHPEFSIPSKIYKDQLITVTGKTDVPAHFSWDFEYPNQASGLSASLGNTNQYIWTSPGIYDAVMYVETCNNRDSIVKQIVVLDQTTAPIAGFYSNEVKTVPYGTAHFVDTSLEGPVSWTWEVQPANGVRFVEGTLPTSQFPIIQFILPGTYEVKLKVENSFGADSSIKASYIQVIEYCHPTVSMLSSDIGISQVDYLGVSNSSSIGNTSYSNYCGFFEEPQVFVNDSFAIEVRRESNHAQMDRIIWVDWNRDGDFDDSSETVASETNSFAKAYSVQVKVPAFAEIGLTVMRIGASSSNTGLNPCGASIYAEFEDYSFQIVLPKMSNPTISLIGKAIDSLPVFASFSDLGAIAFDFLGQNISQNIQVNGAANSAKVGTYFIWYRIRDSYGNSDSIAREVVVYDSIAPQVQYAGNDTLFREVFSNLNDDGIVATDNYYSLVSDITVDSTQVNKSVTGVYPIYYTVKDSSHNAAYLTKWVKISDTQKPEVLLNGANVVEIEVHTSYYEQGARVQDNYCQGIISQLFGSVDTSKIGTYPINYTATDCENNQAVPVIRTVHVVDRTAPVIELFGADLVNINRWENYTDAGFLLKDNYNDSDELSIEVLGNWVNSSEEGLFYIQYKATDLSGNIGYSPKRIIDVRGISSFEGEIEEHSLILYPNPSTGVIWLKTNEATTVSALVQVYDAKGSLVLQDQLPANSTLFQMDLGELKDGVYEIRILDAQHLRSEQFILIK